MIYVRITEGFGNQLFRYACAFAVAKETGDEICIDTSGYAFRPRGYMLDKLNISGKVGDFPVPKNDGKVARMIAKAERWCLINKSGRCKIVKEDKATQMLFTDYDFSYKKNIYIDGYWQNYRYFDKYKKELLDEFLPLPGTMSKKALHYINKAKTEKSIAVHIRRGDYSSDWLIPDDYYIKAFSNIAISDEAELFIFCEDADYGKSLMHKIDGANPIKRIVYMKEQGLTDLEEFYLMSSCQTIVMANSTYSWWAAYISNESKVFAPDFKQWSGSYNLPEWTTIKV